MYILKEDCFWTTSVAAIHFFYGSLIISLEHFEAIHMLSTMCFFIKALENGLNQRSLCSSKAYKSLHIGFIGNVVK